MRARTSNCTAGADKREYKRNVSSTEKGGFDDDAGDTIWIDVRCRTPVFQVAKALRSNVTRDTNTCSTVSDTGAELGNVAGLVSAGKSEIVVLPVHVDVLVMPLRQLLDGLLDSLHATLLAHRLGGVVAVAASTVPVALERLGVEGYFDAPLFCDADEEVTRHPEVITHGDPLTRADLELPLRRHDLGVDTADVDTRVETCAVVSLDQITSKDLAGTDTAIIWTLRTGETAFRPAIGRAIGVEQSVLLLESEPRFRVLGVFHDLFGMMTEVGAVGCAVVVVGLGKDEDVVTTTEGIFEDCGGAKLDVGVVTGSLVC